MAADVDAALGRVRGDLTAALAERAERVDDENERLRGELVSLQGLVAILLRKLGGEAFISDAEQMFLDWSQMLVRHDMPDGYRLSVRERARPVLSEVPRPATDKE